MYNLLIQISKVIYFLIGKLDINPFFLDPYVAGWLLVFCWAHALGWMILHVQLYYGAYFASEIFYLILFIGGYFVGGSFFTVLYFISLTEHFYECGEGLLEPPAATTIHQQHKDLDNDLCKDNSNVDKTTTNERVPHSIGLGIAIFAAFLLLGNFPM